jgi:hypothetical protein
MKTMLKAMIREKKGDYEPTPCGPQHDDPFLSKTIINDPTVSH